MDREQLTYRELADRIRAVDYEENRGINYATLNLIVNGRDQPSQRVMKLAARAFGLEPDYFAEYRMAKAMAELDWRRVGFDEALRNLNSRTRPKRR